jgi:hypothetical protein
MKRGLINKNNLKGEEEIKQLIYFLIIQDKHTQIHLL